jgi:DNA polymerase III epsilon subunit-like protein
MSRLVFVDTETTGLQPWWNEVWEIAVIERKVIHHDDLPDQVVDTEHVFHVKPDLTKADPNALRISRFYERTRDFTDWRTSSRPGEGWQPPLSTAKTVAQLLDGAHLVGAVPSFDAAFLQRFLHRYDQAGAWHYHLIDVEALAVGYLNGLSRTATSRVQLPGLPWDSDQLTSALGLPPVSADVRHTALGDARWARDMYDACAGEVW